MDFLSGNHLLRNILSYLKMDDLWYCMGVNREIRAISISQREKCRKQEMWHFEMALRCNDHNKKKNEPYLEFYFEQTISSVLRQYLFITSSHIVVFQSCPDWKPFFDGLATITLQMDLGIYANGEAQCIPVESMAQGIRILFNYLLPRFDIRYIQTYIPEGLDLDHDCKRSISTCFAKFATRVNILELYTLNDWTLHMANNVPGPTECYFPRLMHSLSFDPAPFLPQLDTSRHFVMVIAEKLSCIAPLRLIIQEWQEGKREIANLTLSVARNGWKFKNEQIVDFFAIFGGTFERNERNDKILTLSRELDAVVLKIIFHKLGRVHNIAICVKDALYERPY